VLGSSEIGIVYLLTSEFTKIVLLSVLIALPVSYFASTAWLDTFAFRTSLNGWYFLIAGLLALLIAWLTVSIQAFRAAHVNPASCLRDQ
jgi:ABC-type antimicrobial peptide transport system permease subunit